MPEVVNPDMAMVRVEQRLAHSVQSTDELLLRVAIEMDRWEKVVAVLSPLSEARTAATQLLHDQYHELKVLRVMPDRMNLSNKVDWVRTARAKTAG